MHNRRSLIALMAAVPMALAIAGCGGAGGGGEPVAVDEDMFMGKADAPITMVEYASVACPVCAQWHKDVLPDFKAKYIDTGEVKLITREMNAHNPAFSTVGFLLARCAGRDKYYEVTDAIYRQQSEIESKGNFREALVEIGKRAGVSESEFNACITPEAIQAQNERVQTFARQDNVNSTPTFVIDGRIVAVGYADMRQMDAIIATARNKAAGGSAS